ncbi:Bug family tripartite tricarboxylate transporter substrate binding protein [Pseudothauera rhizosphaerae]|uniref:Tripartite tricarboxylate transporter substrate binding protein n=1 Tax=Pseudothauera rhizosphaerae TaxID=2565932 RepID=A0A4S4B2V4_9RHOO|nr:tripartite tricarboxylate transporter substrate binding protein [Pseudothauera rhizosphaerae]THF65241.1 tripartite tricarboxylate transporter substrate binding protein [Pseudothauera rhizosphaerae]
MRSFRPFVRTLVPALFAAAFVLPGAGFAQDADWPQKPIKLLVPYPPGGACDTVGRLFAEKLSERLKQPVVVENKPGAGTAIAAEQIAKSAPDGYTLEVTPTGQLTILPHVARELRFDAAKDFTPISQLAYTSVVIAAAPNFPASSLPEVVTQAKAQPGGISFSSSGSTTIIHLAGEYFANTAGISLLHVPFKGSAPAVTALLGSEVNLSFDTLTILAPQIRAGKVKGLAIAAAKRSPLLPDVPTVAELGYPGFEVPSWFGLIGPAGLPPRVVERLNREIAEIQKLPEVQEKLAAQGLEAWPSTPGQFARRLADDSARYGKVVQAAGIRFD